MRKEDKLNQSASKPSRMTARPPPNRKDVKAEHLQLFLDAVGLKETPWLTKGLITQAKKTPAPQTTNPATEKQSAPPTKKIHDQKIKASNTTPSSNEDKWNTLFDQVSNCQQCALAKTRTKVVFGYGDKKPQVAFIGEGPGEKEDLTGLPFVGAAGQLLTAMLASIDLTREQVYILNTVKCRPPNNRKPDPEELSACQPHLNTQLQLLQPKIVVALGATAAHALLGPEHNKASLTSLRGRTHNYTPLPKATLLITYHPSYLIRSPGQKSKAWQDLKLLKQHLLNA